MRWVRIITSVECLLIGKVIIDGVGVWLRWRDGVDVLDLAVEIF